MMSRQEEIQLSEEIKSRQQHHFNEFIIKLKPRAQRVINTCFKETNSLHNRTLRGKKFLD